MPINDSTSSAVFRWRPAAWLRVSGGDAATFLQGQFTHDLRRLATERAVYGLWLTVKGKVVADSFVLRDAATDTFWIGSYFSQAGGIRERLESHVIADDVTIEDVTAEWEGVSVLGEAAAAVLEQPGGADLGFAFRGRRDRGPGVEWVYPRSMGEPPWLRALTSAARNVDADEMQRRRIDAGIPAVPTDIGPADLPNEAGLEADAISYTKGCYLGQEVMARLKSMGQVRRRLLRVQGDAEAVPVAPAPLFAGPRQVGELRSAVRGAGGGWVGLAMLSLLHVTAETQLAFAADGAPRLRLVDAP